jgi:Icc-related predicted phosphoesterase
MKILFVGDLHGHVFHLFAVLLTLRQKEGICPNMIIQVGDLGAFPDPEKSGLLENKFVKSDPTELDFSRFLRADDELAASLRALRKQLGCPIHFIGGNHEDHTWLRAKGVEAKGKAAPIDSFGLFLFVPNGSVVEVGNQRIGFLGGGDPDTADPSTIDENSYDEFLGGQKGKIDIMVAHNAPHGVGIGHRGQTQGSQRISRLIETLRPRYLIAGHYHHLIGPRKFGDTVYLGLAALVPPVRRDPIQRLLPGSMALLELANNTLRVIQSSWLGEFDNKMNYVEIVTSQTLPKERG